MNRRGFLGNLTAAITGLVAGRQVGSKVDLDRARADAIQARNRVLPDLGEAITILQHWAGHPSDQDQLITMQVTSLAWDATGDRIRIGGVDTSGGFRRTYGLDVAVAKFSRLGQGVFYWTVG